MKKMFKYLPIILLFAWACNPMEEVYDDLDATILPYSEDVERTLTEDDYTIAKNQALKDAQNSVDSAAANSIVTDMAFNSTFTGNDYIPYILSEVYSALNNKSTAMVTYNTNLGEPEYLAKLEGAQLYELSTEDYANLGGSAAEKEYLSPAYAPTTVIPAILTDSFPDATAGTLVLSRYKYVEEEGASAGVPFETDFSDYEDLDSIGGTDGWNQEIEAGTRGWKAKEYSANQYAQYSAYKSEEDANIAYLITPDITLSAPKNLLSFDINVAYWTHDGLEILISEDFNGSNFGSATWTDVTSNFSIPQEPTNGYGTFTTAGTMDISDFSGTINIAFKYTGSGNNGQTTTYQIDNILVKEIVESEVIPEVINTYFEFDGTNWNTYKGVYALNPADYKEMGLSYNNFSQDNSPQGYLPIFLSNHHTYAQEGEVIAVTYDLFVNDSTMNRKADEYILESGVWSITSTFETSTKQFVQTGATGWIFDPTIKKTLSSEDYQLIVDYVKANMSADYIDSYGTAEFYHGASAYYSNFDLRLSKRSDFNIPGFEDLAEEDAIKLTWQRVEEAIILYLTLDYPDATPDINGVPIYYWITYDTYENDLAKNKYTGIFYYDGTEFVRMPDLETQAVTNGDLTEDEINWNR